MSANRHSDSESCSSRSALKTSGPILIAPSANRQPDACAVPRHRVRRPRTATPRATIFRLSLPSGVQHCHPASTDAPEHRHAVGNRDRERSAACHREVPIGPPARIHPSHAPLCLRIVVPRTCRALASRGAEWRRAFGEAAATQPIPCARLSIAQPKSFTSRLVVNAVIPIAPRTLSPSCGGSSISVTRSDA